MAKLTGLVLLDNDQESVTLRCLRSVAAGSTRPEEIVLVENGGAPVDLEADPRIGGLGVTVIRSAHNVGAAQARNLGLDYLVRNTGVERFVLLDNDTTVPPELFTDIAEWRLEPLEVGAPILFDMATGEVQFAGGTFDGRHVPHVRTEWPQGREEPMDADWAPTAALFFDRATWLTVGGFESWFEFTWEDIDWCHRVWRAGGAVKVLPKLQVRHQGHQSSGGRFGPERIRRWSRNGTVFLLDGAAAGRGLGRAWFAHEVRSVARELRAGWTQVAFARLRGLTEGLGELLRRRRARKQ